MGDPVPESNPEDRPEEESPAIFTHDAFRLAEMMLDGLSDPERPREFGPYRLIEDRPIGAGNMGEVWLAEDTAANRLVAIKFLRHTADADAWATRETHRLGALEHRSIARLYAPGILEDGTRWLAIEYVKGVPLDVYCTENRLTIKRRLGLFRSVCHAVQYAHSRQIVHGDLKPSNILINSDGEPKLLDFGLAQQFQNQGSGFTQSPSPLGYTPAYAAPEQFRNEPIGISIDVYALGVILYELLTGTLPSPAAPQANLPTAALEKQGTGLAGEADWHDLDAIFRKAVASRIDDRYPSVEALIRDIDRYEASEPVDARRPHPISYRLTKFLHRHRSAAAGISFVLIVIAILIGFFTFRLARERNRALAEAVRTQKVKQFFLDTFSDATEDALPSEKPRFAALFLDRGAREAESLQQDLELQSDVLQGLAAMYQEWGNLDAAEQTARRAVAIAQSTAHLDPERVARARLVLGNVMQERGKYSEALAVANEVLGSQVEEADYPVALTLLANTYLHLGDFPRADSFNQQALTADQKLYGLNSGRVADDLMNLGNVQLSRGQYRSAENEFRRALAVNESVFGKDSAPAADSASYVAQALYFQGGREEEESAFLNRALTILERARGDADARVAFTVAQMGANALERKDLPAAEKDFVRAAAIYRAARGDDHQSVAIEMANAASVSLEEKQYARAEQGFREVLRRFERVPLPPDNMNVGIARIKLGHALLCQKKYVAAEPELLNGYAVVSKHADPSVSWLTKGRQDLVDVYGALGQPAKATAFRAKTGESAPSAKDQSPR